MEFDQAVASQIAGKYELNDIVVEPQELLLDPSNLRFILKEKEFGRYSNSEIVSNHVQDNIYQKLINNKGFNVKGLVTRIKTNGWIPEGGFYIKKIPGTKKYLVLEGNRRACAIRYILEHPEGVHPDVLKTIENIGAQQLIVLDKKFEPLIERVIVSTRNTGGVLPFSPIHTAFNAYITYMEALKTQYGSKVEFFYDQKEAKKVSDSYGYSGKTTKKLMGIYRVFDQLQKERYSVNENHYTLISLAISNRTLKEDYFKYDSEISLQMEEEGLVRFNSLCITPETGDGDPPIHEPKQFPKFVQIYQLGSTKQLRQVEGNNRLLEDVFRQIRAGEKEAGILRPLEEILHRIENIKLEKYGGTDLEKELVEDICSALSLMLWRTDRDGVNVLRVLLGVCGALSKSKNKEIREFSKEIEREAEYLIE